MRTSNELLIKKEPTDYRDHALFASSAIGVYKLDTFVADAAVEAPAVLRLTGSGTSFALAAAALNDEGGIVVAFPILPFLETVK